MKTKGLILLLFVSLGLKAQVPGYMGLKCSIKYDCGIMWGQVYGRPGTPAPMVFHNGSIDYVITRDLSIGVKYCFMQYKSNPGPLLFEAADYTGPTPMATYTQHTAAIILKKFLKRKGYIAPVGRYFSFGLYYQYAIEHSSYASEVEDPYGNSVTKVSAWRGVANYGGFLIGYGRNFVVANRLLIDLGGNLSVPCGTPSPGNNDARIKVLYRDVALRNLIQFYLGFGVLAF